MSRTRNRSTRNTTDRPETGTSRVLFSPPTGETQCERSRKKAKPKWKLVCVMCPAVPLRLLRELGFVHKLGPGQAGEVLGGGHQAHGVTRDAKTEGRPYRAAYEWRRTKKGERRLCSFGNPRLYFRISLHSLCCFLSKTVLKATPHPLIHFHGAPGKNHHPYSPPWSRASSYSPA